MRFLVLYCIFYIKNILKNVDRDQSFHSLHWHINANYFLIAKIVVAQDTMECTERSILSYRGIEFQVLNSSSEFQRRRMFVVSNYIEFTTKCWFTI